MSSVSCSVAGSVMAEVAASMAWLCLLPQSSLSLGDDRRLGRDHREQLGPRQLLQASHTSIIDHHTPTSQRDTPHHITPGTQTTPEWLPLVRESREAFPVSTRAGMVQMMAALCFFFWSRLRS